MKIKELISELSELDPEMEVVVEKSHNGFEYVANPIIYDEPILHDDNGCEYVFCSDADDLDEDEKEVCINKAIMIGGM